VLSRGLPGFIGTIPPLKHNAFFRVWQPLSPPIAAAALLLHCARRFTADNRGTLGHMRCLTRPDADKVYGDLNFCHGLGSTIFPFRRWPLSPCCRPSPGGTGPRGETFCEIDDCALLCRPVPIISLGWNDGTGGACGVIARRIRREPPR